MAFIVITCILSSHSFSALLSNFNYNCVAGASIVLKEIPFQNAELSEKTKNDVNLYKQKITDLSEEFNVYYLPKNVRQQQLDEIDSVPKTQIYQFLNKGPPIFRTTTEKSNISYETPTNQLKDTDIFKNCMYCHRLTLKLNVTFKTNTEKCHFHGILFIIFWV